MTKGYDKTSLPSVKCTDKACCFLYAIIFLCLVVFSSTGFSQSAAPVTIGTVSGQLEQQNSFAAFTDYLEARLPDRRFEVRGFDTIEALMANINDQSLDFAFTTPAAFVELREDSDFRVLATITQPAGGTFSPWLAGTVFTRESRSDINSMSDVADKRVVALSEFALGGWLSAVREWEDLGIAIDSDLASVGFVFSYSSVVSMVCNGEADIGVLSASTFMSYALQCDEALRILPAPENSQDIIYPLPHSTRLYPEVAFAMFGQFEEDFTRDLTRALLDIDPDSEIAQSVNISGFTAPLSYRDVQALMQELRLGPFRTLSQLTLKQILSENIYTVTLTLTFIIILISVGFISALILSRKFQYSENYRKQIFEGSHIPMVVIGKINEGFLDMNAAAVKQYGYESKEELIGKSLMQVSSKEQGLKISIQEAFEILDQKVKEQGESTIEWNHVKPDGEKWLGKVHLMSFDSGDEKLIQATVEDITEQRKREEERAQLEQQLEFSQRMESIGRLAGGIAHDFNNLLTVINGYCEILLEANAKNAPLAKILEQIRKAGNRAAELTQKLLTFSRRQATSHVPVNLGLLTEDSAEMFRSVLGEDIQLQLDLKDNHLFVFADPGQLQQVLLNLVVNAKDAMPEGGVLNINTKTCSISPHSARTMEIKFGTYVEMTVRDNGKGMDKKISKHIFDPFFTTKDTGTGLGLSTVYGIIQQSMGSIIVDSEAGEGTTFTILLPVTNVSASEQLETSPETSQPGNSYTIMVVEDQQEISDYTESVLQTAGHRVISAQSGEAAIELMTKQKMPIHLLVTDVVMEGMSGGELAELFNQRYPDIPVLFISGYPADALARHGIQQGTKEFLSKPFSPMQLHVKINQIMKDACVSI